jgi:hypothetical protein
MQFGGDWEIEGSNLMSDGGRNETIGTAIDRTTVSHAIGDMK